MRLHSLCFLGALSFVVSLSAGGCGGDVMGGPGGCALSATLQCQADFLGYSCPGTARPDTASNIGQTIQGIVCTDEGQLETNGNEDFCCTAEETTCAYDPGAGCMAPSVGYSCMGADRPEAFDSTIYCGTGLRQNELIVYCCGAMSAQVCMVNTAIVCPVGTDGWTCTGPKIPGEADLGVDQSRADSPLVCNLPTPAGTGTSSYCCYTPTAVPTGGTCLPDQTVTGCAAGAFAFECTGPDTPDQDYPRVSCTQGSVHGLNFEGIAAQLYCCAYDQTQ